MEQSKLLCVECAAELDGQKKKFCSQRCKDQARNKTQGRKEKVKGYVKKYREKKQYGMSMDETEVVPVVKGFTIWAPKPNWGK
jgi:hypothetical protein